MLIFRPSRFSLLAGAILMTIAGSARADDQPFLTLYTTDIDPQGGREAEQWFIWRADHAHQSFDELLSQSEIEYGITDDFQGSLYLNYDWSRTRDPGASADTQSLVGGQMEFIYRIMNVYFDPFGLAFYLEPSYGPDARGLETKILLQKNFFNDTLRLAFNTNFEDDWSRIGGRWQKTSALEFDSGASYNITPDFSAGIEFDNERAFNGLVLGSPSSEQTSAFFIGPTIQYISPLVTVTFGAQTQLPIGDNSAHIPGALDNGYVSAAERYRVALRFSKDF